MDSVCGVLGFGCRYEAIPIYLSSIRLAGTAGLEAEDQVCGNRVSNMAGSQFALYDCQPIGLVSLRERSKSMGHRKLVDDIRRSTNVADLT